MAFRDTALAVTALLPAGHQPGHPVNARPRTKVRQVLAGTDAGATYEEITTNE